MNVRELHTGLVQQVSVALLASTAGSDVIKHGNESHTGSLRRPSCIKGGLAALCFCCMMVVEPGGRFGGTLELRN